MLLYITNTDLTWWERHAIVINIINKITHNFYYVCEFLNLLDGQCVSIDVSVPGVRKVTETKPTFEDSGKSAFILTLNGATSDSLCCGKSNQIIM